jgi:hypothetical protein
MRLLKRHCEFHEIQSSFGDVVKGVLGQLTPPPQTIAPRTIAPRTIAPRTIAPWTIASPLVNCPPDNSPAQLIHSEMDEFLV